MKKILLAMPTLLTVSVHAAPVTYVQSTTTYKSAGVINLSSGTIRNLNTITLKFNDGTTQATAVNPAGLNKQIQFNNAGVFGADTFVWDVINHRLGINNATPAFPLEVTGKARMSVGIQTPYVYRDFDGTQTINNDARTLMASDGTGSVIWDNARQLVGNWSVLGNEVISGALTASSATVAGQFSPMTIKWPDGTIQTSSPTAVGTSLVTNTITGTGTITPNAALQGTLVVNLTGNLTVNGPTGGYDGQKLTFRFVQDSTGRTITLNSGAGNFRYGSDIPTFTPSGPSLTDYVGVVFNSTANRWDVVSIIQGF